MSNRLTPALLAAAITAVLNAALGGSAMSWNIFLAAAVAMAFGLDTSDSDVAGGSPAGHSLASAFIALYAGGMLAYASISLGFCSEATALTVMAALGSGAFANVLAEMLTRRTVFTFPRNARPRTWLRETVPGCDRLWPGWGRLRLSKGLADMHLNALSVSAVLVSIWLAPGAQA